MSGNSLGSAGVQLYADTAQFQGDMGKAAAAAEREMRRIQRESQMASAIVNELGKRMATTAATAEQTFARQESATRRASAEVLGLDKAQRQARQSAMQLNYQITDIASGLATGQSPFYVLMQQGGQLRDQFGSVGGAVKGLGAGLLRLVSPAGVVAAGVAAVGYAMYQGAQETEDFQRQLALTGNVAALTETKLAALAASSAQRVGRTVADSRDTASALAGTGSFGPQAIEAATNAMARYQKITGETADEAIKRFASIADGAAKWAADQNRSMHFLTVEEFKRIKALEDHGKTQEAMRLALEIFDKEMSTRHVPQLGIIGTSWKTLTGLIEGAKRAVMDWGKPDDIDGQLAAARKRLAAMDEQREKLRDSSGNLPTAGRNYLAAQADVAQLEARASLQRAGDAARAKLAEVEAQKIRAITNPPPPPKPQPRDYLGEMDQGFTRRVQEWAERNQAALDKVEEQDRETEERMQQLIANANQRQAERDQARADKGSFGFGVQTAAKAWWDDFTDQAKRGSDFFVSSMQAMEDAVISWARTGKFSASDFFASMAEDFLREMVKMAQAKAFFNAAGEFGGSGSWLSTAIQVGSAMFGFANGTPYVQKDGPAYLHEGERVLTSQQNRRFSADGSGGMGGAGGGTTINDNRTFNVGQGVSMAQVTAAVRIGMNELETRLGRRQREGAPA